jgi:hypothetical protein
MFEGGGYVVTTTIVRESVYGLLGPNGTGRLAPLLHSLIRPNG